MEKYIVYCHTLIEDNRRYIGITCMKPSLRWRKKGQRYKSNRYFYNAIQKYGWNNFKHEILYEELSKEEAKEKEIELIKKYNTQDDKYGFNLTAGGESGFSPNKSTREKMRKSAKGNKSHLGCKNSQEMKENMRKIKNSYWQSEENKAKHKEACQVFAKKVAKIDKNTNEIIKIYSSLTEASKGFDKGNIGKCCNNKLNYNTAYGYKWMYV